MTNSATLARALCMVALASGFMLAVRAPAAQLATPGALAALKPGLWEISVDGAASRAMCLADAAVLTQVRHGAAACTRLVIADERNGATVHYSCPGAGWGRTEVRRETSREIRIETQGIAGGAPFAFTAHARRTGD